MISKGWFFVIVQFLCIVTLLFVQPFQPILAISVFAMIRLISIFLGCWAIVESRKGKLGLLPEVLSGSKLITSGPYSVIRHPMYTSLLLFFLVGLIQKPTIHGSIVYAILLLTLVFKMNYEERLLNQTFPDYKEYQNNSHRIIPFIY